MDTQLLRNAFMERDVKELVVPFGKWAADYLGVKDKVLEHMFNANEACSYILSKGYNKEQK